VATAPVIYTDFSTLLSGNPASTTDRNDARYGEGVLGEMYISTKQGGGKIYLVTNSVPLSGDFNKDRVVDAADYTVWRDSLDATGYHLAADGNGDGKVDSGDYILWRKNFGQTWSATGAGSLATPEPASAALAALASLVALSCRVGRRFTH
jgi:hypothetical protein